MHSLILFILDTDNQVVLSNSGDPGKMPLNAAFLQGLHCLLRKTKTFNRDIDHNLEILTCDSLNTNWTSPY